MGATPAAELERLLGKVGLRRSRGRRVTLGLIVIALVASALVQFIAIKAGLSMPAASSAGVVLGLALPALLVTAAEGGWTAAWALVRRSLLRLRSPCRAVRP